MECEYIDFPKFLHEKKLDENGIRGQIHLTPSEIFLFTGSVVAGHGTVTSDLDAYVLCDDVPAFLNRQNRKQERADENRATLFLAQDDFWMDVEIYRKDLLASALEQINAFDYQNPNLKVSGVKLLKPYTNAELRSLFHRLGSGHACAGDDASVQWVEKVQGSQYHRWALLHTRNVIEQNFEDIIGFLEAKDWLAAAFSTRDVLLDLCEGLLFQNKISVDRRKWIPVLCRRLPMPARLLTDKILKTAWELKPNEDSVTEALELLNHTVQSQFE